MLTNEQRAHDFALVFVKHELDSIKDLNFDIENLPIGKDGNPEYKIDVMEKYMDVYSSAFDAFEKCFPSTK